ncbi:hypothetical protein F5B19DRAFT_87830 [Rostrohypoxylon terebratum]|nr:hypothetical protein F5B19DRAFT_87830 [Rostrohypoxylon terebratum]
MIVIVSEDVTDDKEEIFKGFKATIRRRFSIPGDISFYVGFLESGKYQTGRKITDLSQTLHDVLGKTKVLIIRYDEKKTVAGGGSGMGGNAFGGKAFGGDGYGEKISGMSGAAYGGQANVTSDGLRAKAGRGAAGELVQTRVK